MDKQPDKKKKKNGASGFRGDLLLLRSLDSAAKSCLFKTRAFISDLLEWVSLSAGGCSGLLVSPSLALVCSSWCSILSSDAWSFGLSVISLLSVVLRDL